MKKFLSLAVMLVLAMTMSVCSFAANSPVGKPQFSVDIVSNSTGTEKTTTKVVQNGDQLILTAEDSTYKFEKWIIEGEYELVKGALTDKEITIIPKADLKVNAKYSTSSQVVDPNKDPTSPPLGDGAYVAIALLAVAALVGSLTLKKKLSK